MLRFYAVHLALVRAKVRALKAEQKSATAGRAALAPYLETARDLVAPRAPLLIITHGLSGSGKTHVTQALIGGLRAVRVRSDLERKRLHGLAASAHSGSAVGGGLYDSGSTARTYARLAEIAAAAVRNGFDAIVDATFLRRTERDAFSRIAKQHSARFAILDCVAPKEVLRRRIAGARGGEPRRVRSEPRGPRPPARRAGPARRRRAARGDSRADRSRGSTPRRCSPLSLAADPRQA